VCDVALALCNMPTQSTVRKRECSDREGEGEGDCSEREGAGEGHDSDAGMRHFKDTHTQTHAHTHDGVDARNARLLLEGGGGGANGGSSGMERAGRGGLAAAGAPQALPCVLDTMLAVGSCMDTLLRVLAWRYGRGI